MAETPAQQQYPNLNPYASTNGDSKVRGILTTGRSCQKAANTRRGTAGQSWSKSETDCLVTTMSLLACFSSSPAVCHVDTTALPSLSHITINFD